MFRINKIYENELTIIYKIEGEITDKSLRVWAEEVSRIINVYDHNIILEICEVTFISPEAVEFLIHQMKENVYLLNSPTFVRNMLHSAGFSTNVLD